MTRGDKAKELFEQGYNCSQAVFLAFEDVTGIDRETAAKLSAGFGGGIGRLREVCGAVTGMTAVISYLTASTDPNDKAAKAALYSKIQQAANEFKAENGSYICRELLSGPSADPHNPEPRTAEFYKKRPCSDLCKCAAEIAEKYIGRD